MKAVSENIRRLLRNKNLTLRDLSVKTDIPEVSIYRMLKRDDFKLSTLKKIANVLEVEISYLLDESNLHTRTIKLTPNFPSDSEVKKLKDHITTLKKQVKTLQEENKSLLIDLNESRKKTIETMDKSIRELAEAAENKKNEDKK